MDRQTLERWVEGYRRAWESNDPDEIGALFTEDAKYYTEPYAKAIEGREAIVADWIERKDEPGDTEFRVDGTTVCDDVGFVQGWTRYFTPPPREYSNLWVIRLADDGRCEEFTEWWMKHRDEQG
jgi:ketosteroid isomerase-like protein